MKINPQQREAIRYLDGPLLVLAGAGSGKTRVITEKITYLVSECGLAPTRVAAITFTNKAAREMKERVGKMLPGKAAEGLTVSTFHALGARLLRQECKLLGLKPSFSIFDASDTAGIYTDIVRDADKARLRAIQSCVSLWKNGLVTPDQASRIARDALEQDAARVFEHYEKALRAYQAVDFDDLIRLPVELLTQHEEARQRWQGKFQHLLVDEYQDTNRCQYGFMKLLLGPLQAFTAVGDDDQSIYGWRGADIENLHSLQSDFPRLKLVKLEQNYRSTTRILTAANSVIANNPKVFDKRLWSELGHGDVIESMVCQDGDHEAEWVASRLQAHRLQHRGKWSDYAILYRGNYQARPFEQKLREQKIPYALSGGQSFFERSEIKDITAWLRLIANGDDDPAFIRAVTTPKRGVGSATLEALGRYAGQRHASLFEAAYLPGAADAIPPRQLMPVREFGDFVNRIEWRAAREPAGQVLFDLLSAIRYQEYLFESLDPREAENKWANVKSFVDWLAKKGEEENKNLLELTQTVALLSMLDKNEADSDTVQMATLHAAKGLEFKHVFLVGVEEGVLPHRESQDDGRMEEERRLMYVGITRARMSLTLTFCQRRKLGKEWRDCAPSRFIAEMGGDLKHSGKAETSTVTRAEGRARLENFRAMLAAKQ